MDILSGYAGILQRGGLMQYFGEKARVWPCRKRSRASFRASPI